MVSNEKETKNTISNGMLVVVFSFSSGILACLVSILVKFAFSSSSTWFHTVALVALAFVSNSLMWLLFSKSLALTDKTVYATGLNKLANFVVSAFAGLVFFNEKLDLIQWMIGILLISLGLYLIASSSSTLKDAEKEKHL